MTSFKRFLALSALACVAMSPRAAHAQLTGHVLNAEHSFPSYGENLFDLGGQTVGADIEWSYYGFLAIDVSNTNIFMQAFLNSQWTAGSFNGFRFFDAN